MIKYMMILMLVLVVLSGCTESQKYGTGDPPDEYIEIFGNDNTARLNFMQGKAIDKLGMNVYGFSHTDKAGKVTTTQGLNERVAILEAEVLSLMKEPSRVVEISGKD